MFRPKTGLFLRLGRVGCERHWLKAFKARQLNYSRQTPVNESCHVILIAHMIWNLPLFREFGKVSGE